jgi:hypothetical protein
MPRIPPAPPSTPNAQRLQRGVVMQNGFSTVFPFSGGATKIHALNYDVLQYINKVLWWVAAEVVEWDMKRW